MFLIKITLGDGSHPEHSIIYTRTMRIDKDEDVIFTDKGPIDCIYVSLIELVEYNFFLTI